MLNGIENHNWRFDKETRTYLEIESVIDMLYNWKHVASER
jgi:hypothetical protein